MTETEQLEIVKRQFRKMNEALTVAILTLSKYEAEKLYEENDATAALLEIEKILMSE